MLIPENSKLAGIDTDNATLEEVYNYIAENDICDYITVSDEAHEYGKFATVGIESLQRLDDSGLMNREVIEVYEMFDDNTIELVIAGSED